MSAQRGFWRRFLPAWGIGLVGVVSLLLQPLPPALLEAGQLQEPTPRALVLVNPLLLVTLMALLGAGLAHRVGLGSRLAGTLEDRSGAWL